MLQSILNALIPVFILIGIGYLFQKNQKKDPPLAATLCRIGVGSCNTWSSILNSYALHIALPALIFSSLITIPFTSLPGLSFLLFTFGGTILFMGILYLFILKKKFPTDTANSYLFGGFFGNTAYIGFAYLMNLFSNSAATLSLILAVHLIITFTIGIMILEHSTHRHIPFSGILIKTIKNPMLLAVFFGLTVLIAGIEIPFVIAKAASMIGASASPVVLIALGTFIAREWHHDSTMTHAVYISVLKLIIMPLFFLIPALLIKADQDIILSILESAMPVALTNFALAEIYTINKTMIANAVIVSTLASAITIPCLTWLTLTLLG
jgi:predicted permease